MDEIYRYFDAMQEPDDRERVNEKEVRVTGSNSGLLIRQQPTESTAANNSDADIQILNEIIVLDGTNDQGQQLSEILPQRSIQTIQSQITDKKGMESQAATLNSKTSLDPLAGIMDSDSDSDYDARIEEIFNKKREPSELDIKFQHERERRENEAKNQNRNEMIRAHLRLKISELELNQCRIRASQKMKELGPTNKLLKILEKAAEANTITEEWLNSQFFNNVVAEDDAKIIYDPMFSLCRKICNSQRNRVYDFEAVRRRLKKMYLDDQKRMKIDGSERPSSCRRANTSKYDQVEAERERKRVYHGISRANRPALIYGSHVPIDVFDYNSEAAKRFRMYSEGDAWKELLKVDDEEDEAPASASPKGDDCNYDDVDMDISEEEEAIYYHHDHVEAQQQDSIPNPEGENVDEHCFRDHDLPANFQQHEDESEESTNMNHPKPSSSRNFNFSSSHRFNDDENTTDEENPDLSYPYRLRKRSGFPIQANTDRKKASYSRKKTLSKFNKQIRGKQRSTPIEQNLQFEDADDQRDSNSSTTNQTPPTTILFSSSSETMNLVVNSGRIRLEFITNGVKKLAFDSTRRPSFSNLKSKTNKNTRIITTKLRFSDDTRIDDEDASLSQQTTIINFTTVQFTHSLPVDEDGAPKSALPSSDQLVTAVIRFDPENCDKLNKKQIRQMKMDLAAEIIESIDGNPRARAWLLYDSILSSLSFKSPQNEEIYKNMIATNIMFPTMPHWVIGALDEWYNEQARSHFPCASIYIVLGMDLKVYYAHGERKEDEKYLEFLSSLCRWFKTKSAKQNDKKNKIVSERMVFDPLTSEVHPVDRSFFRVNQMPTLVVSTIPECGERSRAFAAFNEKLRSYVDENSNYFTLLDWAKLCTETKMSPKPTNVEERTRILINALKEDHGLIYI